MPIYKPNFKENKKSFKRLNEVTIPTQMVDSKIMDLNPNVQSFLNELKTLLANGAYSRNYFKLVQAFHSMEKERLPLLFSMGFMKHYLNYICSGSDVSNYIENFSQISRELPTTTLKNFWEIALVEDTGNPMYNEAKDFAEYLVQNRYESILSDAGSYDSYQESWYDPPEENPYDYYSLEDWENEIGDMDEQFDYYSYYGQLSIVPNLKGYTVAFINQHNDIIEYPLKAKNLLSLSSELLNIKGINLYYDKVPKTNLSKWLSKTS